MSSVMIVDRLNRRQAQARLATVSLMQVIGLLVCVGPLLVIDEPWSCASLRYLWIGIGGLLFAVCVFCYDALTQKERGGFLTDVAVIGTYLLDMVMMFFLILHTGGQGESFYTPAVPLLLASALLVESQKRGLVQDSGLARRIRLPFFYTLLAALVLILAHYVSAAAVEIERAPELTLMITVFGMLGLTLIDVFPGVIPRLTEPQEDT